MALVFRLEVLSTICVQGLICWLHWIPMSQNSMEGSGAPLALAWPYAPLKWTAHRLGCMVSPSHGTVPMCSQELETTEHLFIRCPWLRQLWGLTLSWDGHGPAIPGGVVADYAQEQTHYKRKGLTPQLPSMFAPFGSSITAVFQSVSKDHAI